MYQNITNNCEIKLTQVTKSFPVGFLKKKTAVRDLSLDVPKGEVLGLIGPNGSGKSTTIKMILGFISPTSGEISVSGYPPSDRRARKAIGYLPENPKFQKFLTARQILRYLGQLCELQGKALNIRCDELLEMVHLTHAADERVRGFSKGMVQRLAMAQSLLAKPSILIFDEPMSGLDPLGRRDIRNLVRDVHSQMPDCTLFFSTHILEDVQTLCTSVALLKKGTLEKFCAVDELLKQSKPRFQVTAVSISEARQKKYREFFEGRDSPFGFTFVLEGVDPLMEQVKELRDEGGEVVGISPQTHLLERSLFGEEGVHESP